MIFRNLNVHFQTSPWREFNMTLQNIVFPISSHIVTGMRIKIKKMERNWLTANVFVRQLKLERIKVHVIANNAFNAKQFRHLKVLQLVRVPIRILWSEIFAGLDALVELHLDSLQIHSFQPHLLAPLKKLDIFHMNGCIQKETSLYNIFGTNDNMNVSEVDISGCNLKKSINHTTFSGLKSVVKLRLPSNKIQAIGEDAFNVVFGTLKYLDLSLNHLTSLSGKLFQCPHPHDIMINLNDNPWHCDRRLESLTKLMTYTTRLQFSYVVCKTPPKYAGSKLEYSSSFCDEEINNVEHSTQVTVLKLWESVKEFHENGKIDEIDERFEETQLEHSNVDIKMECEISNSSLPNVDIILTKPSKKITNIIQMCDGEFFINAQDLTNELKLIGLEYRLTNTNDSLKSNTNDILKCTNIRGDATNKYEIETKLQPNRLYRFCIMKLTTLTVNPLNCESFWLYQEEIQSNELEENKSGHEPGEFGKSGRLIESRNSAESEDEPGGNKPEDNERKEQTEQEENSLDAWILKKDRITLIIAFALSGLYGFVVGLFISVGVVKMFPTLIRADLK